MAGSLTGALQAGRWLDGVVLRPLDVHHDLRGSFCEIFSQQWSLPLETRQWSFVRSQARVLRGVYLHRRHDEGFVLVAGRALVGLHDLREGSPTAGASSLIALDAAAPACLVFPPGIAHGWYFHEASLHMQAVSEPYADYQADDNLCCHWADPELGIPWPDREPVILPEADRFPPLSALRGAVAIEQ